MPKKPKLSNFQQQKDFWQVFLASIFVATLIQFSVGVRTPVISALGLVMLWVWFWYQDEIHSKKKRYIALLWLMFMLIHSANVFSFGNFFPFEQELSSSIWLSSLLLGSNVQFLTAYTLCYTLLPKIKKGLSPSKKQFGKYKEKSKSRSENSTDRSLLHIWLFGASLVSLSLITPILAIRHFLLTGSINNLIFFIHLLAYASMLLILLIIGNLSWRKLYLEKASQIRQNWLIFASAGLTALSFPQADFTFLRGEPIFVWFSLVPYFYYLAKQKDLKSVFKISYYWEFLFLLFTLYWTRDFADIGHLFLCFVKSIYRIVALLAAEWILRNGLQKWRPIILPIAFVLGDALRSYGFLAFPWFLIGYTQRDWTSVIMFSRYGGVWLVSLIIAIHNGLLFYLLNSIIKALNEQPPIVDRIWPQRFFQLLFNSCIHLWRHSRYKLSVYAIFMLWLASCLIYFKSITPQAEAVLPDSEHKREFLAIQSVIDPWHHWRKNRFKYWATISSLTEQNFNDQIDFILLTESATRENFAHFEREGKTTPFITMFHNFIRNKNIPLLTGADDIEFVKENDRLERKAYNSMIMFDEQARIKHLYRKRHLVPYGESFPYDKFLPGFRSLLKKYKASAWSPGTEMTIMKHPKMGSFAPLICYEGIFFNTVRQMVNLGADYFVNLTNLMWTKKYSGHMQHAIIAQLRAMEHNRYYIRAANDGLTCVIDPYGRIVQQIPLFKRGVLKGQLSIETRPKTFYTKHGDWLLVVLSAIIGLFFLIGIFNRQRFGNRKKIDIV